VSGAKLYAAMCEYLAQNGWQREEPGSGWWFHDKFDEGTIGDAVFQQLEADNIDTRMEPQVNV
jgi:hypothetical protein